VVLAYLDAQAAKLSALDLAIRRDKPDAVHQMAAAAAANCCRGAG